MPSKKNISTKKTENNQSVFDYFRFGESYSSLVLGIVVVIIGTVLLLSLVRTRSVRKAPNIPNQISVQDEDSNSTESASVAATDSGRKVAVVIEKPTSIPTSKPTATPTKTLKPTATTASTRIVTKTPTPTATSVPTKKVVVKAKPTASPTTAVKQAGGVVPVQGKVYIVKAGDNLWSIAESAYKSGYNWVDIARANKLSNPDTVEIGQKLTVPKSVQKNESSEPEWTGLGASVSKGQGTQVDKITGGKYKVKVGDSLWSIAVRAYGDGYKWTGVAKANKLANPDLIFEGATLNLPRK
jgi:nucleoid-associated protein YgaU